MDPAFLAWYCFLGRFQCGIGIWDIPAILKRTTLNPDYDAIDACAQGCLPFSEPSAPRISRRGLSRSDPSDVPSIVSACGSRISRLHDGYDAQASVLPNTSITSIGESSLSRGVASLNFCRRSSGDTHP
jgi:hypothetical protein